MNEIVPFDFNEITQVAKAMASSGFFQDTRQEAQAIVKVLAGREMGLGPFASMTGIHIIQGRPALGANLIASLVKNDPRYDYKVITLTDATCSIDFFENGKSIGNSTFTAEDARKAGTKNMDKFAKNMLFARAISNGAKWYTPGIFGGAPIYTPEELGAETGEDGYIINTTFSEDQPEIAQPAPARRVMNDRPSVPQPEPAPVEMTIQEAAKETDSKGEYYWNVPSEDLAGKTIGIGKMLNRSDLTPEKRETYQRKMTAIKMILAYRNEQEDDAAREAMSA